VTTDNRNLPVTRLLIDELVGCKSVLDLGCGPSSLLQYVKDIEWSVGVEVWPDYIRQSKAAHIHSEYRMQDIMTLSYPSGAFDVVMLIDVIEHIEKRDAYKLLASVEGWASKKVIIVVPNGFVPQGDICGDGNKKQYHISGWKPAELTELGYRVCGFGGWQLLRGDGGNIVPTKSRAEHYLLAGVSLISEPFVHIFPEYAFHLFAVLDVKK
jgi:SAM-dependent methyltransferase